MNEYLDKLAQQEIDEWQHSYLTGDTMTFVEQATAIARAKENNDLEELDRIVVALRRRALGSNTQVAWNEYYSALEALENEKERLTPERDNQ